MSGFLEPTRSYTRGLLELRGAQGAVISLMAGRAMPLPASLVGGRPVSAWVKDAPSVQNSVSRDSVEPVRWFLAHDG